MSGELRASTPGNGLVRWLARLRPRRQPALDISWVTPQLAIGSAFPRGAEERLAHEGITAVVDLREEDCDDAEVLARHGIAFLHLPTPDGSPCSDQTLDEGTRWVVEQMGQGGRVLIHCQHGVGRSALLAACVLVRCGYSAGDALRMLKRSRWQVGPNERQIAALVAFEQRQRDAVGERGG